MEKNHKNQTQNELVPYRTFGLTLLQLMALLSFIGIASTLILRWLL